VTKPTTDNTNSVLDPAYGASEAKKHFSPQLAVLREMADYGSRLLMRALPQTKTSVPDWIVVSTLFRQVVATLDALTLCLESGAVEAAHVHARGLFEARLYLEWVLTKGKDRWARQLYVATLRDRMSWANRIIPGTPENAAYIQAWQESYGIDPPTSTTIEAEAQTGAAEIAGLLRTPSYREINASFEKLAEPGREPDWYRPGSGSPGSIWAIARDLNRRPDYLVYKHLSGYAHGTNVGTHSKVLADGVVTVEPIRSVEHFIEVFPYTTAWAADAVLRITQEYRGGELPEFRALYEKSWRPRFALPQVVVNTVSIPF
jgi:Family of unknown function (DUF5677)